jgi:PPK2 family polyphosphate:nucleotide phosphotransferase
MAKLKPAHIHKFIKPYLVTSGKHFRLKDHDPKDTHGLGSKDKPLAKKFTKESVAMLADLQDVLYAQREWGMLLIFQAMDAAGKDSTIKHVMSGVNPQGVDVYSFKEPSTEELAHDFLWRTSRRLPPRGKIAIFNRSYYEEVLVVRVHPEFLEKQGIPDSLLGDHLWKGRYEDITALERYLNRNGIAIRKFFLNVSKEEQKKRFLERLDIKEKNWKFSPDDVKERQHWGEYQQAYEKMIANTATESAPWVVVPADHKWFTRLVVVATIVDALTGLNLEYPKLSSSEITAIKAARKQLLSE